MTKEERITKEREVFEDWKELCWTDAPNQDGEMIHEQERIAALSDEELLIEWYEGRFAEEMLWEE